MVFIYFTARHQGFIGFNPSIYSNRPMSAGDGGWLPGTRFVPSSAGPRPSGRHWHAWTGRLTSLPQTGSVRAGGIIATAPPTRPSSERDPSVHLIQTVEINRVRIEILNWLSYKSDCLKSKERERQANIWERREHTRRSRVSHPETNAGHHCRG